MYILNKDEKLKIKIANNFYKKLTGLSFKKNINYGMRFKTKAIETFFMLEKIDLCITDKNNKIITLIPSLKKKIYINKNAYYIYELPNGYIKKLNLKINTKLKIVD